MIRWRTHDTLRQWDCVWFSSHTHDGVLPGVCLTVFNSNGFAGSTILALYGVPV